jgi:multiple sugar transport system substrate-binding protein
MAFSSKPRGGIFMKRRLLSIFVTLCLMMTLIACSGGAATTSSDNAANTGSDKAATKTEDTVQKKSKEKVELQFWDMVWGPPEYIETAQKLVGQFNSEHPDIQVKYQSTPWNNWYQTFTTAIASGTAPDISTGAGFQAFQFYDMGAILPIDDLIDQMRTEGSLEDFYPGTIETLNYDGHYVSLPWGIDIRVPFYRKDLFDQAGLKTPTNWDELRAAAKALTKDGKYGMAIQSDTGGTHYFYTFLLNNGGGMFKKDREVDFMNERNVEAAQFINTLVKDGSVNPASAGYKGDDAQKSFGQGDSAIILRGPGFADSMPELKDKIGMFSPLEGPHGDKGTVRWVNNIMIYKQSKHPDEAKIFLKWWSENNGALWTEGHTGQLPARQSVGKLDYFQNNAFLKQVIDEWIPVGFSTGHQYPSAFPQLNEIEGEGVMQTLIQELAMGKDPMETMKKAEKRINEIMKK